MKSKTITNFLSLLPEHIQGLLRVLAQYEARPYIVGGIIRDYLLYGKIGNDWDIEVHFPGGKKKWQACFKAIEDAYDFQEAGKGVYKSIIDGDEIELTLPRIEDYSGFKPPYGHSDFAVELRYELDPDLSFQRRDFTVNAMAFLIQEHPHFIDPYGGAKDLQLQELRHVSASFPNDPVRFLRAFRFQQKLSFSFAQETKRLLKDMSIVKLSAHYFWEELLKCNNPVSMLVQIKNLRPSDFPFNLLSPITSDEEAKYNSWLIVLEKKSQVLEGILCIKSHDVEKLSVFTKISKKKTNTWARLKSLRDNPQHSLYDLSFQHQLFKERNLKEIYDKADFDHLAQYHEVVVSLSQFYDSRVLECFLKDSFNLNDALWPLRVKEGKTSIDLQIISPEERGKAVLAAKMKEVLGED